MYISNKKINFDQPKIKNYDEKLTTTIKKKKFKLPDFSKPNVFFDYDKNIILKNQKNKENINYSYAFNIQKDANTLSQTGKNVRHNYHANLNEDKHLPSKPFVKNV